MASEHSGSVVALRRATKPSPKPAVSPAVEEARRVLRAQIATLADLVDRVDERFAEAVAILLATEGHVVVSGVGKSGQIGRKIASTLASTGTPALFVNAAEAYHGDLGMITARDTALLISHSGETDEVVGLLPHLRALGVPVIAMAGRPDSSLARGADVLLDISVEREACPNNLAPTSSTLATLAIGDALAIALMRERAFTSSDFARFHPGGALGRKLLTRVADVMRPRARLPIAAPTDTVGASLMTMTEGRLGLVLVMNGERLVGLVTDGDLRRAIHRHPDVLSIRVAEIMTRNPVTVDADMLLADAHQRMQAMKLKALVVLGGDGKVAGVVEVFDQDGDVPAPA
jgi:arabinose-5-phosphate isomerase